MDAARRAFGANAPGGSARTPPAVPGAKNGVPDLSAFLNAVRADGSPDFASMARASGMDPRAFQAHAESLWSEMDALAGDPAAYRAFLEEKARDAGVDAFGGGGGGGGDIRFREEAKEASSEETDRKAGPGNREAPGLARADAPRATFLAPAPTSRRRDEDDDSGGVRGDDFGVGVVAVWRARESLEELTPVPSALTNVGADAGRMDTREGNTNAAGGVCASAPPLEVPVRMKRGAAARVEKVALPDPRIDPGDAAEGHSPLAALASAAGAPPPLDATVYDVEAHPDAVARALEDPAYQAALIEAATRLAESQAGAPLFVRDPPGGRRCYARRGEAPPRAAAAAAAADARRRGEGVEGMSASLLTEIAGMGLGEPRGGSPPARRFSSGGEEKGAPGKKALIEEVQASRSVRVERDAAGAPTLVSVTLRLPQLVSMRAANLRVGARFITLDPGPGEPTAAVALPVAVDPDAARAKWTKKTRTLAIDAPPAGAVSESKR